MTSLTRKWPYLALAMLIELCAGIGYTWSVFQTPLIEKFHWDLRAAALIFTLQVVVSTLTPMALGRYQVRWGMKAYLFAGAGLYAVSVFLTGFSHSLGAFYLFFGVGAGLGIGMIYPCLVGYGVRLYPTRSGLASGLLAASYGAGAIVWAPVAVALNARFGILGVYQVLGVLFVVVIAVAIAFLRDIQGEGGKVGKGSATGSVAAVPDRTWQEMVRSLDYYLLLATFAIGTACGLMIIAHASPMLRESARISPGQAALMVGLLAVFNAAGRVLWGSLSDLLGRPRVIPALFVLIALAMLVLFNGSGRVFIGAVFLVSLCYGGFAALIAPATADVFGQKHVGVNYGFLFLAYGIGGVLGPQLGAIIKGATGGYRMGFLAACVLCLLGILLSRLVFRPRGSSLRTAGAD